MRVQDKLARVAIIIGYLKICHENVLLNVYFLRSITVKIGLLRFHRFENLK